MPKPTLQIKKLEHGADIPLPSYESETASGMDLPAAILEDLILNPGRHLLVPTGLSISLPNGFEAQIRPRSGLAMRHGITVLNTPGTIDSDYRGEIQVILINHGRSPFAISRGMRIAQMVISPVTRVKIEEVSSLNVTRRGRGGFGSTGL